MLTADWMERNAIFARDYKLTGNADLRDIGGADRRSSAGWPSSVWINSLGNFYTFPAPTASPTVAAAVPGLTRHNFLANSDLQPEVRYYGFYSFAKHEISDTLAAFAEVSFRRAETLSQSAPTPNFNWNEQGDGPLGEIMIPAANPFNPWNEDIDYWLGRFVLAGNRLNDLTSDTPRILLGLEGKIEPLNMNWELAANYSKSTVVNKNGGAIQDQLLQDALNGIVVGAGTPEQTTLYLNPFGPSDQRVYDYMVIGNPVTSSYEVRGYDFTVNGTLMDLPAGALGYAAGVEYREEELDDRKTALNETAQIVGGSEGSSVMGDREVWSVYAEVVAPVVKMVELQAAARYENYSDFGTTTKPKVAAVFRPLDSLLVRTSYGESFLAPNLPFLYTSQSTSFTSQAIADPKRPQDGLRQVKMLGGGNPNLQPEETKTFFVGLAFEPKAGGLKGFYAGVDFFVFDSDNLIDRFDAEDILDNEDDPAFAPLVVRNPPEAGATIGGLNHVITTWTNVATRKYRGFDVDLRYRFETGSVGTFDLRTSWTYQDEIAFDGTDFAGTRLYPEWRGNILAAWNHGDWAASVFVDYIGSRSGTGQTNAAGQQVTNSRYGSYIRVNPSVSYRGLWDTSITVGVRNVFDKEPPVDYGDNLRYTSSIMNYERAFWYVRLSREF
jgi:outer membrane receptor protein involved in Fe transport